MKKEDLTYEDWMDLICLDLKNHSSTEPFILVEGESDVLLYQEVITEERCTITEVPGSSGKLQDTLEVLQPLHQRGLVIAIRDADFLRLNQQVPQQEELFLTDGHDMDVMLLMDDETITKAIRPVSNKITKTPVDIRNDAMRRIEMISCIKWLNSQQENGFDCKVSFRKFLAQKSTVLQVTSWVNIVAEKSAAWTASALLNGATALQQTNPDLFELTNGHDLVETILHYLEKQYKVKGLSRANFEYALRIAYTPKAFQRTQLYQALQQWATQHNTQLFPEPTS